MGAGLHAAFEGRPQGERGDGHVNPLTVSTVDEGPGLVKLPERPVPDSIDEPEPTATEVETATAAPAEPAVDELPLDLVFTVLKNQRRRRVLEFLRDEEGPVSLSDLSEYIAATENDKTVAELNSRERKRVYVGLYQCHLPMMDDAGIVAFNKDRGFVELEDVAATFESYLEEPTAAPTPWHAYYLAIAVVGGIAVAGSVAVAAVPAGPVGGGLAMAVGGLALLDGWRGDAHRDLLPQLKS